MRPLIFHQKLNPESWKAYEIASVETETVNFLQLMALLDLPNMNVSSRIEDPRTNKNYYIFTAKMSRIMSKAKSASAVRFSDQWYYQNGRFM